MEDMYSYLAHKSKDAITKSKCKYAKGDIKLSSNFDIDRYVALGVEDREEMLNDVCDMIDDHGLTSIRELGRFAKECGSDYSLPSMGITDSILRSHTGLIKLYFGAVCQERKYGQNYVDTCTGEIKK